MLCYVAAGLQNFRKAGWHPAPAQAEGQDAEEIPLGSWLLSSDEESIHNSRDWCVLLLTFLLVLVR